MAHSQLVKAHFRMFIEQLFLYTFIGLLYYYWRVPKQKRRENPYRVDSLI